MLNWLIKCNKHNTNNITYFWDDTLNESSATTTIYFIIIHKIDLAITITFYYLWSGESVPLIQFPLTSQ